MGYTKNHWRNKVMIKKHQEQKEISKMNFKPLIDNLKKKYKKHLKPNDLPF